MYANTVPQATSYAPRIPCCPPVFRQLFRISTLHQANGQLLGKLD
jgi:hypothetical protein